MLITYGRAVEQLPLLVTMQEDVKGTLKVKLKVRKAISFRNPPEVCQMCLLENTTPTSHAFPPQSNCQTQTSSLTVNIVSLLLTTFQKTVQSTFVCGTGSTTMNSILNGFLATPTIQSLGLNAHNELRNLLDDLNANAIMRLICERIPKDKIIVLNQELQNTFGSSDYDFESVVLEMARNHRPRKSLLDYMNGNVLELNDNMIFSETFPCDYQVIKVLVSQQQGSNNEQVNVQLENDASIVFSRNGRPEASFGYYEKRHPEEYLLSYACGTDHSYQTIKFEGNDPIFGGKITKMVYKPSKNALERKFEFHDQHQMSSVFTLVVKTDQSCERIISVTLRDAKKKASSFSLERLQRLNFHVWKTHTMTAEELRNTRVKKRVRSPDEIKLRKLEQISQLEDDIVYLFLQEPNHALMNHLLSLLLASNESNDVTVLHGFLSQPYKREDTPYHICWKVRLIKRLIDSMREPSSQRVEETQLLHMILQRANYLRWLTREDSLPVMKAMELFDQAREEMAKMIGKDLIIFLGNTGAGKSTSINYFLGHRLIESPSLGEVVLKVDDQQIDAEEMATCVAKIGQSLGTSETAFTKSFEIPDAVKNIMSAGNVHDVDRCCLVDSPGFCDTRGENYQILTMLSIQQTLQQSNSIRAAVLTVPYQTLIAERGGPLVDLFRSFKQMLPRAFVPGSHASKSVYVVITKCTDAVIREQFFETRIDTFLQEDLAQLQRQREAGASLVDLEDSEERITIWKSLRSWSNLSTSAGGSHIIYLDTRNRIQSKSILQAFLQSPGLQKSDVSNAFENKTLKKKLTDIVNQSADTNLSIARLFRTGLPAEITAKLTAVEGKQSLIDQQEAEKHAHRATIQTLLARIVDLRRKLTLFLAAENGDPARQGELAEIFSQIRNQQIADTTRDMDHLKQELQRYKRNATMISEDIEDHELRERSHQARIAAIAAEIRKLQEGSTKKELHRDGPHQKLHIRHWRDGATDRLLEEVRAASNADYQEGICTERNAADYRGTLLQHAFITKDHYIVPNDTQEQKLFVTTRRGGSYRAVIEGAGYKLKGAKATADRLRICYQYNLIYDGTTNPFFAIHHVVPNCDLNHSTIQNLSAKIDGKRAAIARVRADIVERQRELDRVQQDIARIHTQLSVLAEALEQSKKSAAIDMLRDSIRDADNQIADVERCIVEKDSRIAEYQVEKQELLLQLSYLRTKHAHYALLVANQRSVMMSLYRLCSILSEGIAVSEDAMISTGFEQQCLEYIKYFDNHQNDLWELGTKCLAQYESFELADADFNRLFLDDITPQVWAEFSRTFKELDLIDDDGVEALAPSQPVQPQLLDTVFGRPNAAQFA